MADSKITALTAISTVDPTADPLVIVDVSDTSMAASGTTKKSTINQLLGAGGTATLASATITGDLTVDTSTLKVDSANNRVGINTATPVAGIALHVCDNVFGANLSSGVRFGNSGNNYYFDQLIVTDGSANPSYQLKFTNQTLSRYLFGGGANYWEWYANNTLGMTLNSTGLGVGVSPSYKLDLLSTSYCESRIRSSGNGQQVSVRLETKNSDGTDCKLLIGCGVNGNSQLLIQDTANTKNLYLISGAGTATNSHAWYSGGATATMTLDASGNLLVGTTSTASSSGSGFKVTSPTAGHFNPFVVTSANSSIYSCWDIYSTGGTAGYRFFVTATGTVNAVNATISAISDSRLKENVQDLDVGLNEVLALKPRKFDWKAGKGKDIKGDRGFIAQEFETVFPNLIDEWKDQAPEGEAPYKSVRQDLIPVLVKAIQELTARVQTLETR